MNGPIEDLRQHGVVVYRVLFARVSYLLSTMRNREATVFNSCGLAFHSHRGFSPVIGDLGNPSGRFNGFHPNHKRKPLKRFFIFKNAAYHRAEATV